MTTCHHYQMQIIISYWTLYGKVWVTKYIRINEAGINKRMRKIQINSFSGMESFWVFTVGLYFLIKSIIILTCFSKPLIITRKSGFCFAAKFLRKVVIREHPITFHQLACTLLSEFPCFVLSSTSQLRRLLFSRYTEHTSHVFKRNVRWTHAQHRRLSARVRETTDWT